MTGALPGGGFIPHAWGEFPTHSPRVPHGSEGFTARCKRITVRSGHQRALAAVLSAVWRILTTGHQPHSEFGGGHYAKRRPRAGIRNALQQLRTAGVTVPSPPR